MGKQLINLFHGRGDVVLADEGTHFEIFLDAHGGENVVGLGHESHTLVDPGLGGEVGNILAIHQHFALAQVQHAEDGFHGSRFAGAVRPDDDSDLALFNADGAIVEECLRRPYPPVMFSPMRKLISIFLSLSLCGAVADWPGSGRPLRRCLVFQAGSEIGLDHFLVVHDFICRTFGQLPGLRP